MRNISINKKIKGSKFLNNLSWLFVLNFSNTIIPYFTFPYITRVLLPSGYGRLSFALSFIAYFQTIIDYGFNLTGARLIAQNENSTNKISNIYSSILLTKGIFFVLLVPLIVAIPNFSSQFSEYRTLIYILLIMVFSNVLMPTWLFQGLQKMKFMTIVSLVIRIIFLFSVFTFIKSPNDIYLYTLIYSISFLLISLSSLLIIRFKLLIKLTKVSVHDLKNVIIDGFYVFTSSIVIRIMGSTGVIVLGLFHSSVYTGYYSGISKIDQVITMLFYPIGQALFPIICQNYDDSFKKGLNLTVKTAKVIVPLFIIPTIILIIYRDLVVNMVLGPSYSNAADILIFMSFLPILSIISNFMGTQVLVASGHTKEYSRAFLKGSLISILLFLLFGYYFSLWGVAIAAVLGSFFNLIFLYWEIIKIKKIYM